MFLCRGAAVTAAQSSVYFTLRKVERKQKHPSIDKHKYSSMSPFVAQLNQPAGDIKLYVLHVGFCDIRAISIYQRRARQID